MGAAVAAVTGALLIALLRHPRTPGGVAGASARASAACPRAGAAGRVLPVVRLDES